MGAINLLLIVVMLLVVLVLCAGVIMMIRGGESNQKYANKIMRWRVVLQALALLLVCALFLISGK